MTDTPANDDRSADQEWGDAVLKGTLKHILPGFWPIAVGITITLASTGLAVAGAIRLGAPWTWAAAAWAIGVTVYFRRRVARAKAAVGVDAQRPVEDRRDEVLAKMRDLESSRWTFLRMKVFWYDRIRYTLPKAILTTYALMAWWPVPAAVAVSALPLLWAFAGRAIDNTRVSPALGLLLERRGPEGLPTPEV